MKELQALYDEAKLLHKSNIGLKDFITFPSDIVPKEIKSHWIPAADVLIAEKGLHTEHFERFRDALIDASPHVMWRETYKGTEINSNFLDRFACYEIIGRDAPFSSKEMRSFVVYQPPGFYYPFHEHPAEEIYVVLAGEAKFSVGKKEAKILTPGDHIVHPKNVPHALETYKHPVMAYVVWRNEFDTKPVWSKKNRRENVII